MLAQRDGAPLEGAGHPRQEGKSRARQADVGAPVRPFAEGNLLALDVGGRPARGEVLDVGSEQAERGALAGQVEDRLRLLGDAAHLEERSPGRETVGRPWLLRRRGARQRGDGHGREDHPARDGALGRVGGDLRIDGIELHGSGRRGRVRRGERRLGPRGGGLRARLARDPEVHRVVPPQRGTLAEHEEPHRHRRGARRPAAESLVEDDERAVVRRVRRDRDDSPEVPCVAARIGLALAPDEQDGVAGVEVVVRPLDVERRVRLLGHPQLGQHGRERVPRRPGLDAGRGLEDSATSVRTPERSAPAFRREWSWSEGRLTTYRG